MLSCSRRHMRTLLNMMESRGWLTWEAEAGRGKRSRLTFLYTGLIDAILLKEIFGTLLLQGEAGIEKG